MFVPALWLELRFVDVKKLVWNIFCLLNENEKTANLNNANLSDSVKMLGKEQYACAYNEYKSTLSNNKHTSYCGVHV